MGLRETVASWTLGMYPNCLKYTMAVFDVPETIAVTRKLLCQSGVASLTRLQVRPSLFPANINTPPVHVRIQLMRGMLLACHATAPK